MLLVGSYFIAERRIGDNLMSAICIWVMINKVESSYITVAVLLSHK